MTTVSPRKPLKLFVWRFSNYKDLSGRGGLAADGRWHNRPQLIIYCADEAKTAYLEILQHFRGNAFLIPDSFTLLEIGIPGKLEIECVSAANLPSGWAEPPAIGWPLCQPFGNSWLRSGLSPVLQVPSAVREGHFNYLINPVHKDCDDIRILRFYSQPWPEALTAWIPRQIPP